ncbi:MAG TPA: tRNA lysidine(34) synthetase TilS [Blastocatellia bacterium]|nr:tRNA lysidine(34) synthetase TilS [Blastocatellia bacterium]
MLGGTRGVLIAVSGGADSVALLDMLVRLSFGDREWELGVKEEQRGGAVEELGTTKAPLRLCPSAPQPVSNTHPPFPITRLHVAHLDHMLRGGESAADAEFVRALAGRLGIQVTVRSADVRGAAKASGRGIEEMAREIRYDFLLGVANEAGCDRIAVGHTMTDQAETFLMRLIRGAGLRGLAAMRPVSKVPIFRQGKAEGRRQKADNESLPSAFCLLPSVLLIRPLLCITREEVDAYCRQRGLEFRTDATNLSLHYTRNRIRNDVLPALRAINPRVAESISRAAENIAGDQDALDGLASSLLRKARFLSDAWRGIDGGTEAYSVAALLEQPAGMRRRMIIEAIRVMRAAAIREKRYGAGEVSFAHVAAVEGLLAANASGKHITLPCSLEVWREFDALVFKPVARALKEAPYQSPISSACPDAQAGGFAFTLQRNLPNEMLNSVIEETRRARQRAGRDWTTVALDDRALPEELVIRPRLRGQRAHVFGQRKTIKLKNLMIDHRIPSSRRATWPLVTTPDGVYIWSPGLPPALEFAARDETRDVGQRLAILRALAI